MFDVGYGELLLIAIVALLVLGPDKLPGALRTAGLWIARIRRSFDKIRSEIEQEVGADEIRRQIHNQIMLDQAAEIRHEIDATARSARNALNPEIEPAPDRATALARATSNAPPAADPPANGTSSQ